MSMEFSFGGIKTWFLGGDWMVGAAPQAKIIDFVVW